MQCSLRESVTTSVQEQVTGVDRIRVVLACPVFSLKCDWQTVMILASKTPYLRSNGGSSLSHELCSILSFPAIVAVSFLATLGR